MCNLGVKNSETVHVELVDQGGTVFAEIMEDLRDLVVFQYSIETNLKRVDFQEVKHVADSFERYLNVS